MAPLWGKVVSLDSGFASISSACLAYKNRFDPCLPTLKLSIQMIAETEMSWPSNCRAYNEDAGKLPSVKFAYMICASDRSLSISGISMERKRTGLDDPGNKGRSAVSTSISD